jgi:hypothetical protein
MKYVQLRKIAGPGNNDLKFHRRIKMPGVNLLLMGGHKGVKTNPEIDSVLPSSPNLVRPGKGLRSSSRLRSIIQ